MATFSKLIFSSGSPQNHVCISLDPLAIHATNMSLIDYILKIFDEECHETRLYAVLFSPIVLTNPSHPNILVKHSFLEHRNEIFFP
jgi:hypothetical protein